jgi:hypothetical protein
MSVENDSLDISRIACCDLRYELLSGRSRVSDPATYCSSKPRTQSPAVARWQNLLLGLATEIREISRLERKVVLYCSVL